MGGAEARARYSGIAPDHVVGLCIKLPGCLVSRASRSPRASISIFVHLNLVPTVYASLFRSQRTLAVALYFPSCRTDHLSCLRNNFGLPPRQRATQASQPRPRMFLRKLSRCPLRVPGLRSSPFPRISMCEPLWKRQTISNMLTAYPTR